MNLDMALKEIDGLKIKLEESEMKYRDLYESAPDMYHTINTEGIIVDCNRTEADILGYSKEELIGNSILDFQTEESRKTGKKAMNKLFNEGKMKGLELQFVKKDGGVIDVSINATVIYNEKGRPIGTRSVMRDITKDKRMMEIIKNSNFKLQAIFDAITDGICLIDKNFIVQEINRGMTGYLGASPLDFINRRCYSAFAGRENMCKDCRAIYTFYRGDPVSYSVSKELNDGYHEFEISIFPVRGEKGGVEQVVYYIKDITEKKRMERQMEYMKRLTELSKIALGVSHEVRMPLQNILTGIDLLESEAEKKGLNLEIAKNLRRFAGDMNFIFQELLDFSKPVKLELKEWDITDVVNGVISSLDKQIQEEKIEVFKEYKRGLKDAYIDAKRIRQVFRNVIENSIYATGMGGKITVSADSCNNERGEFIRINFSDNGCGISNENIDMIFTPFFSTKPDGIGMGLAIAKRFVELHNGDIMVKSEKGKGCEVTVLLPVKKD